MGGIVRFISDPHFGHKNMSIKRGFNSIDKHDEHIINNWNKTVGKRDVTYILGDITMEKNNYSILGSLNGIKRVVLGNHDMGNHSKHMLPFVNSIHGVVKLRDKRFGNIFITHCPIYPKEFDYRINYNIHGHIHDGYIIDDSRYINVCMEVQGYTPKTLEQLIVR